MYISMILEDIVNGDCPSGVAASLLLEALQESDLYDVYLLSLLTPEEIKQDHRLAVLFRYSVEHVRREYLEFLPAVLQREVDETFSAWKRYEREKFEDEPEFWDRVEELQESVLTRHRKVFTNFLVSKVVSDLERGIDAAWQPILDSGGTRSLEFLELTEKEVGAALEAVLVKGPKQAFAEYYEERIDDVRKVIRAHHDPSSSQELAHVEHYIRNMRDRLPQQLGKRIKRERETNPVRAEFYAGVQRAVRVLKGSLTVFYLDELQALSDEMGQNVAKVKEEFADEDLQRAEKELPTSEHIDDLELYFDWLNKNQNGPASFGGEGWKAASKYALQIRDEKDPWELLQSIDRFNYQMHNSGLVVGVLDENRFGKEGMRLKRLILTMLDIKATAPPEVLFNLASHQVQVAYKKYKGEGGFGNWGKSREDIASRERERELEGKVTPESLLQWLETYSKYQRTNVRSVGGGGMERSGAFSPYEVKETAKKFFDELSDKEKSELLILAKRRGMLDTLDWWFSLEELVRFSDNPVLRKQAAMHMSPGGTVLALSFLPRPPFAVVREVRTGGGYRPEMQLFQIGWREIKGHEERFMDELLDLVNKKVMQPSCLLGETWATNKASEFVRLLFSFPLRGPYEKLPPIVRTWMALLIALADRRKRKDEYPKSMLTKVLKTTALMVAGMWDSRVYSKSCAKIKADRVFASFPEVVKDIKKYL